MKWSLVAFYLCCLIPGLQAIANPPPNAQGVAPQPNEPQLYPIRLNGKMGYIDRAGKVVIAAIFDNAWPMEEGFGNVMIGLKRGLIDQEGNILIQPQYRFDGGLENVQEGVVRFMTDQGMYGFLDPHGNVVIPAKFKCALGFSEGLALAISDKKLGYIDKSGTFVIEPQFNRAFPFSEGLAVVMVGRKFSFIDKSGAFVFDKKFDFAYDFSEGLAAFNLGGDASLDILGPKEIGGKWGFIDRTGRVIIEPKFDHAWSFSEGLAGVNIGGYYQGGKWGFIDKSGKYIVEPQYEWIESFSEGHAVVVDDSWKFGFIDKTGRVVIRPQFDYAWSFSGGLAEVSVGDGEKKKHGYIDKKGEFVWPPTR